MGSETVAVEKESGWERDALARFRKGEVEAFEEFVLHYQDRRAGEIFEGRNRVGRLGGLQSSSTGR